MSIFFGRRSRWVWLFLCVLVGTYLIRFIQFNAFSPVLKMNLMETWNAKVRELPPADCAWPVIHELREAQRISPPTGGTLDKAWPPVTPSEPEWKEAVDFVNAQPDTITRLREAVARPHLGYILTSEAGDPNPRAIDVLMPYLGTLRSTARFLKFHAALAASEGDADGVVADYEAMTHLARHAVEHNTFICQLVSVAITALAFQSIKEVMVEYPDLLDDGHLVRIMAATKKFGQGRFRLSTEVERLVLDDFVQRTFTDDGAGDGVICYEGVRSLLNTQIGSHASTSEWHTRLIGPINTLGMPSRKEAAGHFVKMHELFDDDMKREPWQIDEFRSDSYVASIKSKRFVGGTIKALAAPFTKIYGAVVAVETDRAGLLTACAFYRHRLATGQWPQSLNDLVPSRIDHVPIDPHTGNQMMFTMVNGKPLIYSAGIDRDDDGGRVLGNYSTSFEAGKWQPRTKGATLPDADFAVFPAPPMEKPAPK